MAPAGALRRVRESRPLELGRLLQYGLALASAGGALIHLSAAGDHSSEPVEAALFLAAAAGQLVWAGLVLRSVSAWLLGAGGVLSVVLVACWALSRTTGLPALGGAVEPLGFKDGIAVLLEIAVAAGAGLLAVLPLPGRAMLVPAGRFAFHTAALSVAALTVGAMVFAPGHPGSGHSGAELAAGHHDGASGEGAGAGHGDDHGANAGTAAGHGAEAPHGDELAHAAGGAHPAGEDGHGGTAGHDAHEGRGAASGHAGHEEVAEFAVASSAAGGEGRAGHGAHGAHGADPTEADAGATGHSPSGDHSAHGPGPQGGGGQAPEADQAAGPHRGGHDHGASQPEGNREPDRGHRDHRDDDGRRERSILDSLIGLVTSTGEIRRPAATPSG